jgi:hypothetical protein
MSDRIERDREQNNNAPETPQKQQTVDVRRRAFTRLGATSTPVLMTLASRPVFGANCLSNEMSGNLSDPDRGNCSFGLSPGRISNMPMWGPVDPDNTYIESSRLAGFMPQTLGLSEPESLRDAVESEYREKRIIMAAWANTVVTTEYMLTEEQLFQLLDGTLPVPGNVPLVDYLESTMQEF